MNTFLDKSKSQESLGSAMSDSDTPDLKPFIADPEKLSAAERSQLCYRFKYNDETLEFLAIEYRLLPSKLQIWLDANDIHPVDLEDEEEIRKLEKHIEDDKRIQAARLSGLILASAARSWEILQNTEQLMLDSIQKAAKSYCSFEIVDPKAISTLTKAHTAMVKQQIELRKVATDEDSLGNLAGLISKKLDSLFEEIDNIEAI